MKCINQSDQQLALQPFIKRGKLQTKALDGTKYCTRWLFREYFPCSLLVCCVVLCCVVLRCVCVCVCISVCVCVSVCVCQCVCVFVTVCVTVCWCLSISKYELVKSHFRFVGLYYDIFVVYVCWTVIEFERKNNNYLCVHVLVLSCNFYYEHFYYLTYKCVNKSHTHRYSICLFKKIYTLGNVS
jgi:hypothetical protein